MKIVSIRIKNLASLEGLTEIDFTQEPLKTAGIFAITGPTGAGKSTILDALCLALYGKTPRYLQASETGVAITDVQGSAISQGDVRGILRDGTGEGFAEVDFIGVDGQLYRATWRVRRARDKAEGSLQAYSIALRNINTNTDIPGRRTELQEEIERLVGLNFEQFTRSVLLAQGDFTAFLKAAKDEKSALLEKLTGTHIYSQISQRVYESCRQQEQQLSNLNLQRQGIPTLTVEELDALAEKKLLVENIIQTHEKEVDGLSQEIRCQAQLLLLQSSLAVALTDYEKADEIKHHSAARELELKQVEQVQPARTWVDGKRSAENQLADKATALKEMETGLYDLQQQDKHLENLLQNANADFITKTKTNEDTKPLLEEARGLDIQIREKTAQVNEATNEVQLATNNYKEQEKQLQKKQQESDLLLDSIGELKKWKEENIVRRPIAENQQLIVSKLADAGKLLDTLQNLLALIERVSGNIELTKQSKVDLDTQSVTIKKALQTEQRNHDIQAASLALVSITALESDKAAIDRIVGDIIAAEAHWKVLFNSQTDLNMLKQKLGENKNDLAGKEQALKQAVEQLSVAKVQRESSVRMLEKARLAAAENVESLRTQLIPGDPCPVCGSEEHPYAVHNPQLDHVLKELEAIHQQHEKNYTESLALESSLMEAGNQLKKIINTEEKEAALKDTGLQVLQTAWTGFTVYQNCAALPDEQKSDWLAQQLQDKRIEQKSLLEQTQSYSRVKQEQDRLQTNINLFDKQLNGNGNEIKDAERNLQSLEEQLKQHNREKEKADIGLAEIEQSLTDYFALPDWFQHWKDNPEPFLQRISDFAANWKTNTQKLDEDIQQHNVLSETLKAMQVQTQGLLAELHKKENSFSILNEQCNGLTQKRNDIFGGEAASIIEAGLKQAMDAAQQLLDKHKGDKEKLQTAITRLATQKEQGQNDIEMLEQQLATNTGKIQQWLAAYNGQHNLTLDTARLLELLTLTPAWMETERAALREIDDAVTQAMSVLRERETQLQHHQQQRLSERSLDQLNELLTEVKTALQSKVQEKNEIGFRRQQDTENKQRIGDLLGSIEAQSLVVENWAKLNEVIGSSDGKKFRQIAQEYTLDVLLGYANVHLEMLSKRYLLQRIPNTLGLQVLDQDMGDEVRTVYSLSGGESFLVSLALALGLASLSSSRMQVESLFIDEGFGSLDPTTLNIAMDALERLHNQGRKVGVISHVQEMTERIPVQIRVSKEHSGRSKVEVIGNL